MKKAVLIILLSGVYGTCHSQTKHEIGKWTVGQALDEFGNVCSENIASDFSLQFLDDNEYVRTEFNWNGNIPLESTGKYTIADDTLTLTFRVGRLPVEHKYQIVAFEKNLLILDYNLCPKTDSISTTTLKLRKK